MSKKKKVILRSYSVYDTEAYIHFICEGLRGKGCGTNPKAISHYRKEKTWTEICHNFLQRNGD